MRIDLGKTYTITVGCCSVELALTTLQAAKVQGATVVKAYGLWKGEVELSCQVIIAGISKEDAIDVAETLRQGADQESVMLTSPDGTSELLDGK